MIRRFVIVLLAAALSLPAVQVVAQSFRPFTVRDIRVEGLQRTEPGTVFSYLPVRVGDMMTEERAQQAIRSLFATGFFRDVRLEVEGEVLIVFVDERPAVAQIDFSGIREFDPEQLRRSLRDLGLADGRIFDRALLETAEQELKRQYLARGRYAVDVQTTVTPLERNRVGITFAVSEGPVAKIRGINIVGASAFRERDLLALFVLRTPGWLTWYTRHDQYSRQRLAADLETLRSHYQNRGFIDFSIDSTQVSISQDRQDIFITINVTEGERYTVSDVEVAGQTLLPKGELERLLVVRPGEVFSRQRLNESIKAMTDRLGNEGYAFANANAAPRLDRDKRTVGFTFFVDPGRRVYVRRINIAGNTRTRDEVVRREMRQLEGGFFDASRVQLSRTRIDRTQFFSDVAVETVPVPDSADQVDLNFRVVERPTGNLLLGAGFSSVERVTVSGSLSQANIFGSGKFVAAQANTSRINTVYSLSYTDPYYTVDGVSRGFDVYHRRTDASRLAIGPFTQTSLGGGVRFGFPLTERDAVSFGLSMESVELETFSTSPQRFIDFVNQFGRNYMYASATTGWSRDTRDSVLQPNRGGTQRVSAEFAAGELTFFRLSYQVQHFRPLPLGQRTTLFLSGDLGYAGGFGDKPLPFFRHFFGGGPGTVRGFVFSTLGPRDLRGNVLGGNRRVAGTAEVMFPVPGAVQDRSLRLGVFLDAGQVYGEGERWLKDLRLATGVALMWNSPFGPLRLSLAEPLNDRPGDRLQRLQFQFGTTF